MAGGISPRIVVMDVMSMVKVLIMLYMQMTLYYWLLHLQCYKIL